jgi:hypothetical protein
MKPMTRISRLLILALLLALTGGSVSAQVQVSWLEGEAHFPDDKKYTYTYIYRYPKVEVSSAATEEINHYFDTALQEMMQLMVPMYAADPIMAGDGGKLIREAYEVTCNTDRYFSCLMTRSQTVEEGTLNSLRSVVFAADGEYAGQTLTLRGATGVGDSSVQMAALVFEDVWRQLEVVKQAGEPLLLEEVSYQVLAEEFYPESHFYLDEEENAVFYLQPGLLRPGKETLRFVYSREQLNALIPAQSEGGYVP